MMRTNESAALLLVLLGLAGCTSTQVPGTRAYPLTDRPDIEQALRDHYAAGRAGLDPVQLEDIELYRFSSRSDLFAATCDWETDWWGDFIVFEFADGKILWVAGCDTMPTEQSILSLKPVALPGFEGPCLEVYGVTHMGHGNLYLYHFNPQTRRLELVLETFAVDMHQDGTMIRGGKLTPVYYMPTRFRKKGNIVLVGIVDYYPPEAPVDDPGDPVKARRARMLFLYDQSKKRYTTTPDD
ncbi:MAG: hypothetical protein GVY24_04380, partial [Planctomycetes bacterium]|nr:hypothetical protein [Planctomycetota bacterium]